MRQKIRMYVNYFFIRVEKISCDLQRERLRQRVSKPD